MNTQELRVEMIRHNETGETLSKALGITRGTLSKKMNGVGADFTQSEISTIIERYNLSSDRATEIFFTNVVSNKDTEQEGT